MRTTLQLTAVTMVLLAIPANGARVVSVLEALRAPTAHAQVPDAADVAEGMRLYLQNEARPRQADDDHQVWTAGNRHAGLR